MLDRLARWLRSRLLGAVDVNLAELAFVHAQLTGWTAADEWADIPEEMTDGQ